MKRISLSDAVEEYVDHRAVERSLAKATVRGDRMTLKALEAEAEGILAGNLTEKHVRDMLRKKSELTPESYNCAVARLSSFFRYCRANGYMHPHVDLLAQVIRRKPVGREFLRLGAEEFQYLLDATDTERNRAIVAVGLYAFLRGGEMRSLNVSDLNLDRGTLRVTIHKGGGWVDQMPISQELDEELRAWMIRYTNGVDGPLNPDWPLFPGMRNRFAKGPGHEQALSFDPTRRVPTPEKIPQAALVQLGYDIRDVNDKSKREGFHTLRRSGARALFDSLVEQSYDGALRVVQAMLHHQQSTTTERYLGLTLDRHKRDDLVHGKRMFPVANRGNVVPLRRIGNG